MRMIDWLDKGCALNPSAPMFVSQDGMQVVSYEQVRNWSNKIGAGIAADGAVGQPHVATFAPNSAQVFGVMAGIWRAGSAWIPLNARNSISGNIEYLNTCQATWLFYHSTFSGAIEQIRREVPSLKHFVCIDRTDGEIQSMSQFMAAADGPVPDVGENSARYASLNGSGGTTGKSKGCVWTDGVWETMITAFNYHWYLNEDETPVNLVTGPLTHGGGGFVICLMARGAKNVILDRFEPQAILQAIEEHKVTHLVLVPTILYSMLACPNIRDYDYSSLRYMWIAGAPTAPEKLREAVDVFGPSVCSGWGQAEAPLILTALSPQRVAEAVRNPNSEHILKSCGRVAINSRVAVLGPDGTELSDGQTGELAMKGGLRMVEYYNSPETTAEIRRTTDNGWQRTGDIGYRDGDGYYYIVDRAKDMIISGGFNVFSAVVENRLNAHPAVRDCAVFGIPDSYWGEKVHATIELKSDQQVTVEMLSEYVKQELGGVSTPKSWDFVESLPKTAVGKINKRALRDKYWQGMDRNVS